MRLLLYLAFAAAVAAAYSGVVGELQQRADLLFLAAALSLLGTVLGIVAIVVSKTRSARITSIVATLLACPALLAAIYVAVRVATIRDWIPR